MFANFGLTAPVLNAALYERVNYDFADRVFSALPDQFGGHDEKAAADKGDA